MLEILVMALLLFGVPILVVMVLAGAAAYVREGAERELEAMAQREGIDLDDPDSFDEPDPLDDPDSVDDPDSITEPSDGPDHTAGSDGV